MSGAQTTVWRIRRKDLELAAQFMPAAYLTTMLTSGRPEGDWVVYDARTWGELRERFGSPTEPPAGGCRGCGG